MLFDILAVFVITLISSLFICSTSVHGLPTSSSTLRFIHNNPSPDLSSSLRLLSHHPVPSIAYDLGGDISEMLITESNELSTNDDDDDSSSSASFASSFDTSNEPFDFNLHSIPSQSLSRKLLLLLLEKERQQKEENEDQQQQQKRATQPSISTSSSSSSLPSQFSLHSAAVAAGFGDPSNAKNVVNLSQLGESPRLSPSLQALVETNPFARAWLTLLLQKVMEEQPVPYIFKYGRRRRK